MLYKILIICAITEGIAILSINFPMLSVAMRRSLFSFCCTFYLIPHTKQTVLQRVSLSFLYKFYAINKFPLESVQQQYSFRFKANRL